MFNMEVGIAFLPYEDYVEMLNRYIQDNNSVPEKLFCTCDTDRNYIGADNTGNRFFSETFSNLSDCIGWLADESAYAPEFASYIW